MGGAKSSPRINHQTLCKLSYRNYRSRIMPATSAAAAAKKTLNSATCETTETIRACMHYLRRRRRLARDRLFHSHLSQNPWTRRGCYASTSQSPVASEKVRNNSSGSKKAARQPESGVFTEPEIIAAWLSDVRQIGRNIIGRCTCARDPSEKMRRLKFLFNVWEIWGSGILRFLGNMGCNVMGILTRV